MKKYVISLILTLLVFSGCDALGIKQADNSSSDNGSQNADTALSVSLDNQISASTGQQAAAEEILNLQKEIDELISAVNAKDIAVTELENKVKVLEEEKQHAAAKAASVEAELADLKDTISTNNQYRNIALISLLLNILLAYLLIITRIRSKRAALPPAKEDEKAYNDVKETFVETSANETETNNQADNSSTLKEDNNNSKKDIKENEKQEQVVKKRGRPKKEKAE